MKMYLRVDAVIQRYMALFITGTLLVGLVIGEGLGTLSGWIPYIFCGITFSAGLSMRSRELAVLRERPWVIAVHFGFVHLVTPFIARQVGSFFFADEGVVMGLVILAMMPVAASSSVWVPICRGNMTLAVALILTDTLVAPFVIPYLLTAYVGGHVALDPPAILGGLFWMIVFPTLSALFVNRLSAGAFRERFGPVLSLYSKLAILAIILINAGIVAHHFRTPSFFLAQLLLTALGLSSLWFLLSYLIGRLLFRKKADIITFVLCGSMRNIAAGTVIAMTYFSSLSVLAVLMTMFFQQALGYFAGNAAGRRLDALGIE